MRCYLMAYTKHQLQKIKENERKKSKMKKELEKKKVKKGEQLKLF